MPVLDDISHRKKWLNLCWNYLRCNVWGLRLLWVFRASAVCKGLKKNLHSLFNVSFTFPVRGVEGKAEAPVLCWCCASVFHKASCVARVNTVTVCISQMQFRAELWFSEPELRISEAEKKHFLDGHRRSFVFLFHKPPDGNISWMHLGCKSEILHEVHNICFLVFLSLNLSVRPLSTQLHHGDLEDAISL